MSFLSRYQPPYMPQPFDMDPDAPMQPQMFPQPQQAQQRRLAPGMGMMQPQPAPPLPPPVPFSGAPMTMQPQSGSPLVANAPPPTTPVERQPQPGDVATGTGSASKPGGMFNQFGEGFDQFNGPDLLQIGLSLLGQSQNGGDWGAVGQDFARVAQGAASRQDREREIRRQEIEDQRAEEQFKAWREQQANAAGLQQRYNARLGEMDAALADAALTPEARVQLQRERDILGMVGPEGWANYEMAQEQTRAAEARAAKDAERDDARLERQLAASAAEGAKDRAGRAEQARLEAELNPRRDPRDTIQYRADVQRATPWIAAADQARTYTLGRVSRMKEIINELARRGGVNNPLDSDFRIELSRLSGSAQENQALMEEYRNLATGFTLDEVQKLKPASNLDFEVIRKTLPNPNNNPRASLAMLGRMEKELNAGIKTADAMGEWLDQGYSLNGTNDKGETFKQHYGFDMAAPAPTQNAAPETQIAPPKVGEVRDGYRYVGGNPADPKNWQKATARQSVAGGQPGGYSGR